MRELTFSGFSVILRLFGDLGEVKRKKESIHLAKDDTS